MVRFLAQEIRNNKPRISVYRHSTESSLTGCITTGHRSCTAHKQEDLVQSGAVTTEGGGCNLPDIQHICTSRRHEEVGTILKEPSHPNHTLCSFLRSRKRKQSVTNKHFPPTSSEATQYLISPLVLLYCVFFYIYFSYCIYISIICYRKRSGKLI